MLAFVCWPGNSSQPQGRDELTPKLHLAAHATTVAIDFGFRARIHDAFFYNIPRPTIPRARRALSTGQTTPTGNLARPRYAPTSITLTHIA